MAIPTITSVSPARGHTGGSTVVAIVGTGFQQQADPPATGIAPVPPASVRVWFGAVEAYRLSVVTETLLYATTDTNDAGAVDVVVANVGPNGETLGDERVVAVKAFEYARPLFTVASDLERVVKALALQLGRQIHPNVIVTESVDWTDDPAAWVRRVVPAKIPCVILAGPRIRSSDGVYQSNIRTLVPVPDGSGRSVMYATPDTVDLVFEFGVAADHYSTLLGMVSELKTFGVRTPWLYVPRVEGGEELVRFDLDLEGDFVVDPTPSTSNTRTAFGSIVVVGFTYLTTPGFENDQALEVVGAPPDQVILGMGPT